MGTMRSARLSLLLAILAVGLVSGAFAEDEPARARPATSIGGSPIPDGLRFAVIVDQDVDQPDMAAITLHGRKGRDFAGGVKTGDDVAIVTDPTTGGPVLFKGEVVGLEPVVEPGAPSSVVIRAFNRIHRLTRDRKTRTFENVTDADIVRAIATENGLEPAPDDLTERYEAVYQHNQTDLEFLLERAARIGYEVLVDDTRLLFRKPVPAPPLVVSRRRGASEARLLRFHPRLSSTRTVQVVTVRGWDPQGSEFAGKAAAPTILLEPGEPQPDLVFGETLAVTVDHPIFSVDEANAIAKAKLGELLMSYLSGEAQSTGNPRLEAGIVVSIEGSDSRFNGEYRVVGASHRYSHGQVCGEYKTMFKVRRESGGLFFLPEVDDEVLVAFAHGDISQPFVVGSLWDEEGSCAGDRPPE